MSEWFMDWFESDKYLKVYKHRDNSDALKLFNLIKNSVFISKESPKLLDLACGNGRHSILFAKEGYQVTSVDLSQNLLNVALKEAEKNNVELNLIRSDIREFITVERFDLIINLFTSFGYFDTDAENFLIFHKGYDFLLEGGYFIFDYFNKEYVIRNLIPENEEIIDDLRIKQVRSIENGRVNKMISISDSHTTDCFKESVKMYSKDELELVFNQIGFRIETIYGSLDGRHFCSDSDRVIFILRK